MSSQIRPLDDDRFLTLSEFADIAGISLVTLRVVSASAVRHGREWLDARATGNPVEA